MRRMGNPNESSKHNSIRFTPIPGLSFLPSGHWFTRNAAQSAHDPHSFFLFFRGREYRGGRFYWFDWTTDNQAQKILPSPDDFFIPFSRVFLLGPQRFGGEVFRLLVRLVSAGWSRMAPLFPSMRNGSTPNRAVPGAGQPVPGNPGTAFTGYWHLPRAKVCCFTEDRARVP